MDAPAFDAKRFVRPALLTIALYFSIIVMLSMTIDKSAYASGTVAFSATIYIVGGSGFAYYSQPVASPYDACDPAGYWAGYTTHAVVTLLDAATQRYQCTFTYLAATNLPSSYWGTDFIAFALYYSTACPANSTGTSTCTCTDPYVPDPTKTKCVPAACPDHASGTPCVCEAGYEFDPTVAYCVSICPVSDLPPITDPEVQAFEDNPDLSDTARLTARMGMNQNPSGALRCLLTAAAAGSPTVGSAFRPPAYNQHLIDVWRKWVNELKRNTNPVCADMKLKIQTHFQRHKLKVSQGPVPGSLHTLGEAVDVTISLPPANIDALAAGCQLRRPLPVTDSVHFIHQ